jgi:hypothetical protein
MKKFLVLAGVLAGLTANSQSTTGNDSMDSQIRRGLLQNRNLITVHVDKANEIRNGRVSYHGIFVQLFKSDSKLQLINPAAAPEYGSGSDNLVAMDTSPTLENRTRQGLSFFSIHF